SGHHPFGGTPSYCSWVERWCGHPLATTVGTGGVRGANRFLIARNMKTYVITTASSLACSRWHISGVPSRKGRTWRLTLRSSSSPLLPPLFVFGLGACSGSRRAPDTGRRRLDRLGGQYAQV